MLEHKITKEDGSEIRWSTSRNNNLFCLLYNDDKQKFRFTPTEDLNCELFMIGGGGAGGYFFGGGGGAGAAYINNNYTFKKNKTYTFDVGTGGMCDIADINKLFKSGLNLNIYNNTNVNLTNVNFAYDDYSSLGVENSGIMQSFNVNNISIPSSIFNKNTTYIWDGYIKTDKTGYFNITINSKLKTMIWVDKFVFNNANALIEGNNLNDVKIVQLESNRYYNIKIIAYNENSASNNFSVSFEGCQFFNFDKTEEKYVYIPASDTVLTYRNDDNTFETITCKGGGNGGCGFYNKNTNLDGGCGGGSGINKIKGTSIIGPIYNGTDGAIGDYCGGGGGIISAGVNNIGGNGKIINWFNETLIFGAGGNAANLNETRNLGYGCGGNGGECCYYSKLLINNNGNNGCILIYVNSSPVSIPSTVAPSREGFANKDTIMLPDESIASKLIKKSFAISKYTDYQKIEGSITASTPSRSNFFTSQNEDMPYITLSDDLSDLYLGINNKCSYKQLDSLLNQTFIYDMLVISKLYAIIYRLYWYEFNIRYNGNISKWKVFCDNARIKFTNDTNANATKIDSYDIYINNLFSIENLKLGTNANTIIRPATPAFNLVEYNKYLYVNYGTNLTAMKSDVIEKYEKYSISLDSEINNAKVPIYHNLTTGAAFSYLKQFNDNEIANKMYYDISLGTVQSPASMSIDITQPTASTSCTAPGDVYQKNPIGSVAININNNGFVDRSTLKSYYDSINANANNLYNTRTNYLIDRVYIYLEALNIIFNTDSTIILSTLKYHMHYYNLVVYNVSIQYGLVDVQNNRVSKTEAADTTNPYAICYPTPASKANILNGARVAGTITLSVVDSAAPAANYITGVKGLINIATGAIASIDASVATKTGTFGAGGGVIKATNSQGSIITIGSINQGNANDNTANIVNINYIITSPNANNTDFIPNTCLAAKGTKGDFSSITSAAANTSTNTANINNDIQNITTNINTISDLLKSPNAFTEITSNITKTSTDNENTSENFYKNQLDLNETINEYNGELENFNNISFYYKLIIAFAILLILIILFIFATNNIDKNSKISIYVIIIIMIIIAIVVYNQKSDIKENFTIIMAKSGAINSIATNSYTANINSTAINNYKLATDKYITNLTLSLTNNNIANNLGNSLTYIQKLSVVKNEKAEIYKIKKINLMNSIEILKKNSNFYYNIILLIAISIIILNIGLILFLISPAMIIQIIVICVIPFIILVYYISYNIQKSTRLAENKNYWSNYNPSSTTLSDL